MLLFNDVYLHIIFSSAHFNHLMTFTNFHENDRIQSFVVRCFRVCSSLVLPVCITQQLQSCWASAGGQNGDFPPWKLGLKAKISGKREISYLILISWVNSCNDSLFADMTLTLHNSQVHCFSNMQLWACSSLNPLHCLQRQAAKLGSELFYYWPLLRNNNMATNLRRYTWSYDNRRFAACNYWMQTSWQAMQRDVTADSAKARGL